MDESVRSTASPQPPGRSSCNADALTSVSYLPVASDILPYAAAQEPLALLVHIVSMSSRCASLSVL